MLPLKLISMSPVFHKWFQTPSTTAILSNPRCLLQSHSSPFRRRHDFPSRYTHSKTIHSAVLSFLALIYRRQPAASVSIPRKTTQSTTMYKLLLLTIIATAAADDIGSKFLMRVVNDCSKSDGIFPCLKKKAILFFDRASRMESIPLTDGVEVVRTSNEEVHPISENEIDATLPRNLVDKDGALTDMLWDRIAAFANSRTIQLSLPRMTGEDLGKGVEEGRGKMKKMMSMMMMGGAMKMMAMMPLAIAGLFILAGKALITAKIALLLAGIMVLKKLMGAKGGGSSGGGGHGDSHGWQSGGSSGGYDRRAYDASDLAYSGYKQ